LWWGLSGKMSGGESSGGIVRGVFGENFPGGRFARKKCPGNVRGELPGKMSEGAVWGSFPGDNCSGDVRNGKCPGKRLGSNVRIPVQDYKSVPH